MSSIQKNHQQLLRPCAIFLERLNDTFIPSKRYKVDADIIYRTSNEQSSNHNDELSVDVLMLPNNKVKISSSSTFEDLIPNSTNQITLDLNSQHERTFLPSEFLGELHAYNDIFEQSLSQQQILDNGKV